MSELKPFGPWSSVLENRRYEYELTEDSVVLDIGAYIGEWSIHIANLFNCKVHAYEPIKDFVQQINHPNILTYEYAVSCVDGVKQFNVGGDSTLSEDFHNYRKKIYDDSKFKSNNIVEVKTIDINKVLDNHKFVDLIKINIEGGEYDLLNNICENGKIKNINNLQIQFHNFIPNAQDEYEKIVNKLKQTHICNFDSLWRWSFWSLKGEE